ncbi:hypothetical protein M0804_002037 [Polistes exclamans]|nr:hypothetical protein M0804_002037 [Polistes exclamans]
MKSRGAGLTDLGSSFQPKSGFGRCPEFEDSAALILLKTPQIVHRRLDDASYNWVGALIESNSTEETNKILYKC